MNPYTSSGTSEGDGDASLGGGFISQLPAILWQRRWLIIVPFLIALLAAIVAAAVLPSVYRSSALMLVQSPQLPDAYTGQVNSEVIDRRIARIREQITSRPDLIALIEKHSLYRDKRGSTPLSQLVDTMRDDITLTPTRADVPSARADQRTIAFQLAFNYSDPAPAQAVTQDLLDRVLQLDAMANANRATNTLQFLTEQASGLEKQIAQVQEQISKIVLSHGGILGRAGGIVVGGGGAGYDMQIAQLEREIVSLSAQKSTLGTSDRRDPAVVAAEAQLAAARAVYAENHPDVVIAKQRLAQAEEFARGRKAELPVEAIDQQIAFARSQIAALRAAKARDQGQVTAAMDAQARAPAVENQISELQQQLSGLNDQYRTVSDRLMTARAGVQADDQQMGERLLVVDPPVVPDQPVQPNRLMLLGLGAAAGLAAGVLLALAVEIMLSPVRDPNRLAAITGEPPIGIIPVIGDRVDTGIMGGDRWKKLAFWRRKPVSRNA